jgi:hypothetical protein
VRGALTERLVGCNEGVTFWRPIAPVGYGILGDCATVAAKQPTFQVRVHLPVRASVRRSVRQGPLCLSQRASRQAWSPSAPVSGFRV